MFEHKALSTGRFDPSLYAFVVLPYLTTTNSSADACYVRIVLSSLALEAAR